MPYPKCKEFCASTGVRHEEAKLKGQGSGLLEFKGQGAEMVNVEELCWCVRPYPKNVHQPWPLALKSVKGCQRSKRALTAHSKHGRRIATTCVVCIRYKPHPLASPSVALALLRTTETL